ncbi:MAG: HupE/UreJ family protein [Flavobacterium sp.]|nr:HupE/UreJ family protein [Flavobacterium sp.]
MSDFWVFFQIGLKHVLDINGYDHVLFLIALVVPFTTKDWKRILLLVSIFTLGHTAALLLAVLKIVSVNPVTVEFLIPISILITAVFALFNAGKSAKSKSDALIIGVTLFFGLIHGLGFSNYFLSILGGKPSEQIIPLLQFALGIEVAQLIVVVAVLILSYIVQGFLKFSRRDFVLVMSAFVIGVVLPIIIEHDIWKG